jgi:hypothetical protein
MDRRWKAGRGFCGGNRPRSAAFPSPSPGRAQPAPGTLQSVAWLVAYLGIRLRRSRKLTLRGLEGLAPVVTILPQVFLAFPVVFLFGRHVVAELLNQVANRATWPSICC